MPPDPPSLPCAYGTCISPAPSKLTCSHICPPPFLNFLMQRTLHVHVYIHVLCLSTLYDTCTDVLHVKVVFCAIMKLCSCTCIIVSYFTQGTEFTIGEIQQTFRGSIAVTTADNLASQQIGGFKALNAALRMCRQCSTTEVDMKTKVIRPVHVKPNYV